MRATDKEKQAMKKYYDGHKEKFSKYNKQRWKNNKEILGQKNKKWLENNKMKVSEQQKKKRIDNIDFYIQKNRDQYAKHKEKYCLKKKQYYLKNRELIRDKYNLERENFPQKFSARDKARNKIEIPKNQICVKCNINPATQREHRDYSKPFEVSFVCASCNKRLGGGINAI